ncbi:carbamoyltransferase N-terminal domain-containing protein [Pandoraea sputorum]|uniref:carbamoyltransferase N-terminal domain-containing protein n=1 Tax=Pandoraea sputorum TaxID=93222 RepID=UPI001CD2CF3D|nr:carbamoyltransferase N-terminal domain-containing protein [Pandoraea sputorum]
MALAAYEDVSTPRQEEIDLVSTLLSDPLVVPRFCKPEFREYSCFNSGVESVASKRIARLVSDRIFRYFETRIRGLVTDRRPLLISGGCGLNCDWNRSWLDSGLFTDVFVPPW